MEWNHEKIQLFLKTFITSMAVYFLLGETCAFTCSTISLAWYVLKGEE